MKIVYPSKTASPLSEYITELHAIARVSAISLLGLCIFWSYFSNSIIESWLHHIPVETGPNYENLSVYAPFDWIQMRWEIVFLLSFTTLLPLTSIQIYRFSRHGLFGRERNWLICVLFLTTALVPILIIFVWIFGIPALFEFASNLQIEGVGQMYDAASLFSFAMGVSWIILIWSTTTLFLGMTRLFGLVSEGEPRFRARLLAISGGTLILTLPIEFDGLRLLTAILVVYSADFLSRIVPIAMSPLDTRTNIDAVA